MHAEMEWRGPEPGRGKGRGQTPRANLGVMRKGQKPVYGLEEDAAVTNKQQEVCLHIVFVSGAG